MIERMIGTDAVLWHLERTDVPMHTLETVARDPVGLGRQLTLADLGAVIEPRLPTVPSMHSQVPHPVERLRRTAESCVERVELRRCTGGHMVCTLGALLKPGASCGGWSRSSTCSRRRCARTRLRISLRADGR